MYKLPKKLVENIINYLGTKPFNEVAPFINAIGASIQQQNQEEQQAAKIEKEPDKEVVDKKTDKK